MSILGKLKSFLRPRRKVKVFLSFSESSIVFEWPSRSETLDWASIERVEAYALDLYTFDCICIALVDARGLAFTLDEQHAQYNALLGAMVDHLPGFRFEPLLYLSTHAFCESRFTLWPPKAVTDGGVQKRVEL